MKHKLKLLVAATAMAAGLAGQASAAILPSTSGNGELFLVAWSESLQRSYTRDLGIQMNDFLTASNQGSATGGTVAPVAGSYAFNPSATPAIGSGNVTTAGYSLTFQADALMMSWLGTGTTLASDVVWMVGAMDGVGTGQNGRRYLSTVSPGTTETTVETLTNSRLANFTTGDVLITNVNTMGTHATGANGSATATPGDGGAYAPASFGSRWNFNSNVWTSTAGVDQSMNFYFLTPTSTSGLATIRADQYANTQGASLWTLASSGTLMYSAAAVSEVPIPAAVWLFGSGLIGLIGIGRRRNSAV